MQTIAFAAPFREKVKDVDGMDLAAGFPLHEQMIDFRG
jgi:hypothetical protein